MWTITNPTQLPASMRQAHGYPYLQNEFSDMWFAGLDVAHKLLDRHEQQNGNAVYYQDNFAADYIAALSDPKMGAGAVIVFDEVADPAAEHLHRNDQPSWQAFNKAREALKTAPRGAIALLRSTDRWHIRIHVGGGSVSDCKTMRSTGPKPSAREIQCCVLAYEAYTARHQAKKEREILRNFARLRELNLQPGQSVREVPTTYNGKVRTISYKIDSISDTGYVSLVGGALRGSPKRFSATVAAGDITLAQVQMNEPKKTAVPIDVETARLF